MSIASITARHTVQFSETDMAGLVHFSQYFRYMEKAEATLFQSLGFSLIGIEGDRFRGWPRVRASASFRAPLYFEDELEIHLFIKEIKIRAIEYFFRFSRVRCPFAEREGRAWERDLAKGSMTTLFVEKTGLAGEMRGLALPAELVARLTPADPATYLRTDRSGEG